MQTKQLSSFNWTTDKERRVWWLVDAEVSEGLRTESRFGMVGVERTEPVHMAPGTYVYSVQVAGHSVAHFGKLRDAKADAESRALDRIIDFEEHAEPANQRRRYSVRVGLCVNGHDYSDKPYPTAEGRWAICCPRCSETLLTRKSLPALRTAQARFLPKPDPRNANLVAAVERTERITVAALVEADELAPEPTRRGYAEEGRWAFEQAAGAAQRSANFFALADLGSAAHIAAKAVTQLDLLAQQLDLFTSDDYLARLEPVPANPGRKLSLEAVFND